MPETSPMIVPASARSALGVGRFQRLARPEAAAPILGSIAAQRPSLTVRGRSVRFSPPAVHATRRNQHLPLLARLVNGTVSERVPARDVDGAVAPGAPLPADSGASAHAFIDSDPRDDSPPPGFAGRSQLDDANFELWRRWRRWWWRWRWWRRRRLHEAGLDGGHRPHGEAASWIAPADPDPAIETRAGRGLCLQSDELARSRVARGNRCRSRASGPVILPHYRSPVLLTRSIA